MRRRAMVSALALAAAGLLGSCLQRKDLVLYAAGDKIFSEEVIAAFEKETGLNVIVASDTETLRGVALRTKIVKEADNPRADVYWNNELANTILLAKKGLLAPYKSPSAGDIPDGWKDPAGLWTAFGARARVFLVNTKLVPPGEEPRSMNDFLDPKWRGKAGMSNVTGGTTATQAAALFELLGEEKAKDFYRKVKANGVVLCSGNGHVKDLVADGELAWGWTDTNDSNIALLQDKPVKVIYPDQGESQIGTLLIPHSVCLVRGGPNPSNGKRFIDFLLRKETERRLAASRSVQVPVRGDVAVPDEAKAHFIMDLTRIKSFNSRIDFARVAERLPSVLAWMDDNFNQ